MRILVVIDEYGWAFEFFARGWKKYSRHEVDFLKWTEITNEMVVVSDIVFTMSLVIYRWVSSRVFLPPNKTICGIRSLLSHEQASDPLMFLAFIANSEQAFQIAKGRYPSASNIYYLRGSVDGNEWSYADVSTIKKAGWSGNPNQPLKRTHLLDRIAGRYGGISRKSDWGDHLFYPDRRRDDQIEWYRSIGCYVQVSSSEGLSQSLLEAFACGVPVLATSAGDTAKVVPIEWLLPMNDVDCVREANQKVDRLFSNQELAKQVGISNRKKFESEGWCWSVRANEYDSLMETLKPDRSALHLHLEPKSLANSAIVIIPSWNTEKWTEKCLRSVLEQTYKDLGIIFIDDCSSDQTLKISQSILVGRRNTIVISRTERWQALKNWNSVIREQCSNPESVIFQLDGDDWLSCPTAIEEMMKQHRTADVVWSKYVATDGSPCCCSIIRTNDWRNSPWVSSAMRSFKKFLFDAIKPEDFLDWNGKIYELNYDQAIMLPILEMTITERLCFYDKELYIYNRDNPINDDKTHSPQDGWLTTCHIRSRKPYGRHPRYILPKPKPVSVVISSYNQLEPLKLALESFYLQSEPPKEVIVADDGSTDGTLEWLGSIPEGKYPFPLRHVTRQHNGYRLASLQNLGAKKATGDRLLFTNADVVHCPTSISSHGRLADNLFGTGVVSSISEEGVKKVTIGHVLNHLLLKKLVEEYPAERTNLVWRKYGPMVHPSAVWGGNLSVSREIFNRIGGFDEGYDVGWGGEDTSLAKRCWERAGITLVWVDQSVVYHLGHPVKSYALEQKGTERFNATQG